MQRPQKVLTMKAIRPNAGIEAAYRQALQVEITKMNADVYRVIRAAYKNYELAQDANPVVVLQRALKGLTDKWLSRFDEIAKALAQRMVGGCLSSVDFSLKTALKKIGMTVKLTMSDDIENQVRASVANNVKLIQNIPAEYFTQIGIVVMQSVQNGRDLSVLTDDLQKRFGIAHRRAKIIANDQSNKATAALTRARHRKIGITEGIWKHSHAGKKPRPSHVKANNQRFDIEKGMYLDGEWIHPGELINCRCTYSAVIPIAQDQ